MLKGKEAWQGLNPLVFQLELRYQRGWELLVLDSEIPDAKLHDIPSF